MLNVNVPEELVMPQSFEIAVVDVARVIAPVCAVPYVWASERRPVLVTFPAAYVRPEEKVVVATHEGMPFADDNTNPPVPIPSFERTLVADE